MFVKFYDYEWRSSRHRGLIFLFPVVRRLVSILLFVHIQGDLLKVLQADRLEKSFNSD